MKPQKAKVTPADCMRRKRAEYRQLGLTAHGLPYKYKGASKKATR